MGAYLSEPVQEKHSLDEANEYMQVGASSMQGWRISQEDAHNVILKLNEKTSYFAVYDGHGGAEVAKYCSEKLPDFLKNLQSFKDGKYEEALKEAFIQFDATLLKEDVIEELKKIAGERNPAESNSDELIDEEEEEDLAELKQEGSLPLEKVLAKYKAKTSFPQVNKLKESNDPGSSGTSKLVSPRLRGKSNDGVNVECQPASSSAGSSSGSAGSSCSKKSNLVEDTQVSSSESESKSLSDRKEKDQNNEVVSASDEICKTNGEIIEKKIDIPTSSSSISAKNDISPDSSISETLKKEKIQNGNVKAEVSSASGVSSSSSSKQENGPKTTTEENSKENVNSMPDLKSNFNEDDDDDDEDEEEDYEENFEEEEEESDEEDIHGQFDYDEENEEEMMYTDEDEKFCANMIEEPGKDSGCTAVVALLDGRDLYVANAGDSRCVVCRGGKAIDMSIDHKPEDDEELQRIVNAGGHVTLDGRVNGGLNLSRAIGDHAYKMNSKLPPEKQMISALPDVKKIILEPNDEFMILACDGIWNYMSSEEVVELVKEFLDENFEEMSTICEELLSTCLAPSTLGDGTGCDNMTAIIIRFKPPIFELPTKLNPEETIINEEKKQQKSEEENTPEKNLKLKAKKRSVSPSQSDLNSVLISTTTLPGDEVEDDQKQPIKRFKSNEISSSSTSSASNTSSEAAAAAPQDNDDSNKESNEVTIDTETETKNTGADNMDTDAAEAEAAAASIITTSSET